MKVLIIHPLGVQKNWKSDGVATYCNSLVKMFEGDTDMKVMSPSNISVVKCKPLKNFFNYSELKRVIDEFAPDVVHINGYTSLMSAQPFLALRNSNVKIVYTAHWHPFEYLAHPLMGKFFFNVFMKPFVKKYASIVTTINSEDTAFFRRIHSHVVQIPHSIPLESLSTDVAAERDPRMILFVGNMTANSKGAEHIYHIPEGKYEIHCVSANILWQRSDIVQHKGISNDELKHLYAEVSLLVVPSKYEAFSYVTLEALAMGTPVVVSDRVRVADYLGDVKGVSIFSYGNTFYISQLLYQTGLG